MTEEQQSLENLLKHPGWILAVEHAGKEIEARLNQALTNAANGTNDALAISQVRQCVAVRQAITAFVEWPSSRLKVLQESAVRDDVTGYQMSRRGSL